MIELQKIYCEKNIVTMARMPDNCLDSIVTDPPYGISFMGKKWDYDVPSVEIWEECLRVLKPGGYLLSFAGTRTQHRMCVNIEDAGFEIRDMIAWVYGSGFPKSIDLGKKLNEWEGWGTALKPALEPITMARKPLSEKTVVANVLKWGTGGINIEGCRVPATDQQKLAKNWDRKTTTDIRGRNYVRGVPSGVELKTQSKQGRFPSNLIHNGHQMVLDLFPESKGQMADVKGTEPSDPTKNVYGEYGKKETIKRGDSGSAARFFYCPKASKYERNKGLEYDSLSETKHNTLPFEWEKADWESKGGNYHPTVKPVDLMQYLCRLVTPPGEIVYDPFSGSGTTCIAAILEGFQFIASEEKMNYCDIANQRIIKYL